MHKAKSEVHFHLAVSFTTCQLSMYLGMPSILGRCCSGKEVGFDGKGIKYWVIGIVSFLALFKEKFEDDVLDRYGKFSNDIFYLQSSSNNLSDITQPHSANKKEVSYNEYERGLVQIINLQMMPTWNGYVKIMAANFEEAPNIA